MKLLDISAIATDVALLKPTIVGAAFRIYALGGSSLSEAQRKQATGGPTLYNTHLEDIMALVEKMEASTSEQVA